MLILIYTEGSNQKDQEVELYIKYFKKREDNKDLLTLFKSIGGTLTELLKTEQLRIIKLELNDIVTRDWLMNNSRGVKIEPPVIVHHQKGSRPQVYPIINFQKISRRSSEDFDDEIYLLDALESL